MWKENFLTGSRVFLMLGGGGLFTARWWVDKILTRIGHFGMDGGGNFFDWKSGIF